MALREISFDNMSISEESNLTKNVSCSELSAPETDIVYKTLLFSCLSIFIPGAIIFNIILIVQINRKRTHKEFSRFFLTSMAFVDLCVGLTLMPFRIAKEFTDTKFLLGSKTCPIINSLDVMLSSASIIHLSILTFDRYVALCRPFSYRRICNRRNMIVMYIICWLLVGTVSYGIIIPGLHHKGIDKHVITCVVHVFSRCRLIVNMHYELIISALTFFIPGFLILGLNLRLLRYVRKQSRKRKLYLRGERKPMNNQMNSNESQSMRIARTLAVLTGCFFVCWLPFFIVNKILLFTKYDVPYIVEVVVLWLGYANSSMNPLLYFLLQSKSCICKR
ncbi:5-hydroxytryptamine receptor 4-like [Ruditapes philippinarum]|uniref:5-hydroxytryptamine receptor 4-like n=1 Tax=Ruditapes philippinarum TaxID=129788 RepID=UPI00295A8C88|nr:5-hydroxytryptamine receptor 4-like [Ruditapes philippinarum]